jgi:hypothetical protein
MCFKSLNLKKAIASAVVIYALMFLIASALMLWLSDIMVYSVVMFLALIVVTVVVTKYYYFEGVKKIKKPLEEGFGLGIIYVLVSLALDVILVVYGFATEVGWAYIMSWDILLGYLVMLVTSIVVAYKK